MDQNTVVSEMIMTTVRTIANCLNKNCLVWSYLVNKYLVENFILLCSVNIEVKYMTYHFS